MGEGEWSWQKVLEEKSTQARQERDAARAQVERLQHELVELRDARAAEEAKRANAELEVERYREDLRLAAGELRVPMPEPGTDMARLLAANVLMRRERDEARAEVERLKKHIAAQTWDADCDRLPGLEAQVERLTRERDTAQVDLAEARQHAAAWKERGDALEAERDRHAEISAAQIGLAAASVDETVGLRARVAALEAALAEPDEAEVWRLACLCGEPAHALDGRMRVLLVRRVLADLRQRAGVTS